jgi:hypothetical protein
MEKLIEQLWEYLKADGAHQGSAVQQIQHGRNGELRVELVDKVRAAELLSKLLDTSALSPSPAASVSCPCETEDELDRTLAMLKRYQARITKKL